MKIEDMTREKLVDELVELRRRVGELEAAQAHHNGIAEGLRESEKRFRELADSLPETVCEADGNGNLTYVNRIAFKVFGYTQESFEEGLSALHMLVAKDRDRGRANIGKMLSGEDLGWQEYTAQREDGTTFPVIIRSIPVIHKGETRGFRAIIVDITERKQAEEALRESEQKYRVLFESSRDAIMTLAPPSWKFTSGNPATTEMFNTKNETEFASLGPWDLSPEVQPDGRPSPEKAREMIETAMSEGSHFFEWTHKRLNGEDFPTTVLLTRVELGGQVFLQATVRDITKRKQAEKALRESEQRFRLLVETTSDWVWEIDRNGIYTYASPKVKDLLGYEPEEVIGKTPFDFMPAEEAERVEKQFGAIVESREPFAGLQNVNFHKDGRYVVLDTSGVPILDARGNLLGYRGIDRDITKRKQAEEALRASEERYRLLAENATDVIWTMSMNLQFTYVSPSMTKLRGCSMEEAMSASLEETLTSASINVAKGVLEEELEKERKRSDALDRSRTLELEVKRKDGSTVWTEAKVSFLRDKEGRPVGMLGVSRDINERRAAERALRESEEKFRNISEEIADGVTVAINGRNYWINKAFADIFGYTKEELIGKNADFVVIPEEVPVLLGYMKARLAGKTAPTYYETIARRKDGRRINISVSARKISFENKQAIQLVTRDITEQKQFARRLAEAHEEERRIISGQLHDELGQLLTVAKIRVDRMRDVHFNDMVALTTELSEISSLLDAVLEKTRDVSHQLRPPLFDQLGLVPALRSLAAQFKSNTGTAVYMEAEGTDDQLPKYLQMLIYRIVQEALTNVAKHAQAGEAKVSLSISDMEVELTIADDGNGFIVKSLNKRTDCLGLRSMRSRVTDSGGTFNLTSEISKGTTIYVKVPLP